MSEARKALESASRRGLQALAKQLELCKGNAKSDVIVSHAIKFLDSHPQDGEQLLLNVLSSNGSVTPVTSPIPKGKIAVRESADADATSKVDTVVKKRKSDQMQPDKEPITSKDSIETKIPKKEILTHETIIQKDQTTVAETTTPMRIAENNESSIKALSTTKTSKSSPPTKPKTSPLNKSKPSPATKPKTSPLNKSKPSLATTASPPTKTKTPPSNKMLLQTTTKASSPTKKKGSFATKTNSSPLSKTPPSSQTPSATKTKPSTKVSPSTEVSPQSKVSPVTKKSRSTSSLSTSEKPSPDKAMPISNTTPASIEIKKTNATAKNKVVTSKKSALAEALKSSNAVEALVNANPDITFKGEMRVRCLITGHEMKADVGIINEYIRGKRYQKARNLKLSFAKYAPMFVDHPDESKPDMLWCNVTELAIIRDENCVKSHISGPKYQKQLPIWESEEAAKKKAAEEEALRREARINAAKKRRLEAAKNYSLDSAAHGRQAKRPKQMEVP
ncbi:hypothetical protein CCR75_001118 [Bremia lactucae]|uniref:Uncharacterized protein n=1 Tax=Bremia lactucae TaxID=4779 RepID=A0A976FFW5_BRELC|nr:hypothetical protein CCR75_001118 [Bremia lactucae]